MESFLFIFICSLVSGKFKYSNFWYLVFLLFCVVVLEFYIGLMCMCKIGESFLIIGYLFLWLLLRMIFIDFVGIVFLELRVFLFYVLDLVRL